VRFLRPDGSQLAQASAPSIEYATAAAGRLWYIHQLDGHLHSLAPDGSALDLGVLEGLPGNPASGLAVSSDGGKWAWGVCTGCNSGAGRARVYIGGVRTAARLALDEPTVNKVLDPLAWTPRGIVVARDVTGIGGCCYLLPESAARDAMLLDPATLQLTTTWSGCMTSFVSPKGSFACGLTVHLADGSTKAATPLPPVVGVGWAHVDDARQRVVFTVLHNRGQGDGGCPCLIDTEAADLKTGAASKLVDQVTLDGLLPDGSIIVQSAPAVPSGAMHQEWVVSPDGTRVQLGPDAGVELLAVIPQPGA
jgi:hypothetical protein